MYALREDRLSRLDDADDNLPACTREHQAASFTGAVLCPFLKYDTDADVLIVMLRDTHFGQDVIPKLIRSVCMFTRFYICYHGIELV